ncbi:TPA: hypothetical protein ACUT5D_005905 [Pseudomonas aeruginosa]
MQDPKDPGTLDLIEACKRPLTAAERQKRHREKLKRERQAGKRAVLDLGQPERALRSYTVRIGHRFTKTSEILVSHLARGNKAVEHINQLHQALLRAEPAVDERT